MTCEKATRFERIRELEKELATLRSSTFDEEELYAEIGSKLKDRREAVGMTQMEAANFVKMTRTTITNMEAGRQYMPLHKLIFYCFGLGITLNDVLPNWAKADEA